MLLIELIVNCVKDFPILYQLDDPDYKNNLKQDETYNKIADFVNESYGLQMKLNGKRIYVCLCFSCRSVCVEYS